MHKYIWQQGVLTIGENMYLCMNVNLTIYREKLRNSGFEENVVDKIMGLCIDSEAPPEEDD